MTDAAPSAPTAIPPHVKRIAVVIILGAIMSVLDTTIVNVALQSLSTDLAAPLSVSTGESSWKVARDLR